MKTCKWKRLLILKAFFLISWALGASVQAQSTCSPACSSAEICCGTTCYSTSVYATCCGNNACASKEYCCVEASTNKGTCYSINEAPTSCCLGVDCPSGQVCTTSDCLPKDYCSLAACVPSSSPSTKQSPVKVQYFKGKNLTP